MRAAAKHWRDVEAVWPWPHFPARELACRAPVGDPDRGLVFVRSEALDKLERLRAAMGDAPLMVRSAYRTPRHNARVNGGRRSQHLTGRAFDVSTDNVDASRLMREARRLGFNGVGSYPDKRFVHLDIREEAAAWGRPFPDEMVDPWAEDHDVAAEDRAANGRTGAVAGGGAAVAAGAGATEALEHEGLGGWVLDTFGVPLAALGEFLLYGGVYLVVAGLAVVLIYRRRAWLGLQLRRALAWVAELGRRGGLL